LRSRKEHLALDGP